MKNSAKKSIAIIGAGLLLAGCATNTPSETQREQTTFAHQELPGEDYSRVTDREVETEVEKDSVEVEVEVDEAVEGPGTDYTSSKRLKVEASDGDIDTKQSFDVNPQERGPDEVLTVKLVKIERQAPRLVHFPYNKTKLDARDKKILREKAQWLKSHDNAQVVIEGHADERGPVGYNTKLSRERAERVKMYLDRLGVDTDRLQVVAAGEDEPLVEGNSEMAYLINRRVEIETASN